MKEMWFDVETTGVNAYTNDIIQLSGTLEIDGETVEKFNYRCAPTPGAKVEQNALDVNGITEQELLEYPPASIVYGKFVNMLSKYIDRYDKRDKFLVYGYNVRFDFDFLRQFFMKRGDKFMGSWFYFPPVDVMNLAMLALAAERPGMTDFKLGTVAKKLGIEIEEEGLHDAMFDIELTKNVYYHAIKRIREGTR